MGVGFGVLDVDRAGDGGVEDEAVLGVDAGACAGVAAQVGVDGGEQGVDAAFAVAGGEDDGVGGEAGAGALLGVVEVEFDLGGADAACGADEDSWGEGGVGPAAVEGAAVELVVDGAEGVVVDAFVELPLGGDEVVADAFGEGVEVAGVVGVKCSRPSLLYSMGAKAGVRASQWRPSRPAGRARSWSRKISAPDWPAPMTVRWSAPVRLSRWSR